jgi:predicted transcriptional regulator of viral defense system
MGRAAAVDWKSVLKGLPKTFTISSAAQRGRLSAKAKTYLRGVLVRWVKQGKVKRIERGTYQKV